MVMWAEIPYVGRASWDDGPAPEAVRENARQQLEELIHQNYNHPAIVTWSVGNEIDISASGKQGSAHALDLLRDLDVLARKEDPSRPTTFADWWTPDLTERRGGTTLAGTTDLIGYNRYYGWYSRDVADLGPELDALHRQYPAIPMSVSEYGGGAALSQHSDDPRGGRPDPRGRVQPEEYQAWLMEHAWHDMSRRPYLWASWTWSMFDFASPRAEGDSNDLNTKGLMTSDRKERKDAFYFLKASWSAEPVLRVVGRRYTDRAYPVTDVKVYSNADNVRLRVNGKALGEQTCVEHICRWPGVRLQTGANHVVAEAGFADGQHQDAVDWTAPDAARGLAINAGSLLGFVAPDGTRFGSDAFFTGGTIASFPTPDGAAGDGRSSTGRSGDFTYALPVPDGRWMLELSFRDTAGTIRPPRIRVQGKAVALTGGVSADGMRTYRLPVTSRKEGVTLGISSLASDNALQFVKLTRP